MTAQKRKMPWIALAPAVSVAAVVGTLVVPWFRHRPDLGGPILAASVITTTVWMLMIWWSLHRLVFQLAAFWPVQSVDLKKTDRIESQPKFAIFYTTCDDFVTDSLLSCIQQEYPQDRFDVFVCDDSRESSNRSVIDEFCLNHGGATIVRRTGRSGFKAGNLNHAFKRMTENGDDHDWIVIVDADQMLSSRFLQMLASDATAASDDVACIQAIPQWRQESLLIQGEPFQTTMIEDTLLVMGRDLPWRSRAGFYPCLGRVAAVRSSAWRHIGGFPECVSEDFAFAMAARNEGFFCIPATSACLHDRGPRDFSAFVIQLSKYASGTAELIRRYFFKFLRGPAQWVEKLDTSLWIAGYAAMPLVLVNLPLSAWLAHKIWQYQLSLLPPSLASIFVGMTLLSFPVLVSVTTTIGEATRRFFWTFSIFNAALPSAAVSFVRHFWRRPDFRRTPKGNHPPSDVRIECFFALLAGITFGSCAIWWHSPFSLLIASVAAAQLMFPFFLHLHKSTGLGRFSRILIWLPGGMFIAGVLEMWLRGSY